MSAPSRKGLKRRRSNLSSDGDDQGSRDVDEGTATASHDLTPKRPHLGSLHNRRASASPEKFNKGRFEPLPLKTNVQAIKKPPPKKLKFDGIFGPATGPIQDFGVPTYNPGAPGLDALATAASLASPARTNSTITSGRQVATSHLLNSSRPATSQRKNFSLLHSICRHNELLLLLVSYLTLPSLISLYAISKPFHHLFNRHHTAFILSSMRTWAPGSDKVYPWRCYQSLCVKDPSLQQKVRLVGKEDQVRKKWDDLRDVPSLRWLQMVVWREGVCKDMMIQLAIKGLKCPSGTLDSVKVSLLALVSYTAANKVQRMWFILDLPLNSHRIALIHSKEYITDRHLHGMTFFLLKVDMHFTDPVQPPYPSNHGNTRLYPTKWNAAVFSGVPLRKMLLAERSLTPLWRVLRGWSWDPKQPQMPMTRLEILRLWVRHKYTLPEDAPEEAKKQSIMGIPWHEVGTAGFERTGVSFHNLSSDKQVAITHPSIAGGGLSEQQKHQILYPHRRQIILAHEKPREPLLGPDELVIREGVRRKLGMHKKWAMMMLWGFCGDDGVELPIFTEEEYLRMGKGLHPRPGWRKGVKKETVVGEGLKTAEMTGEVSGNAVGPATAALVGETLHSM